MNSRAPKSVGQSYESPTSIFKITSSELQDLFNKETDKYQRLNMLSQRQGGAEGLLEKLQSRYDSGIMGDEQDIQRRIVKFNKNEKPRPVRPPFCDSLKDALNDRIILLVAIFAILSMIPGMVVEAKTGWMEGVAILGALFVGVLISAWNDHAKDRKFVELQHQNRDEDLPVLRGKRGSVQTLNVWDMVVGDVVQLQPGDKVPADCLVLSSVNLHVKEPTRVDQEDGPTLMSWTTEYKNAQDSPFLYADSFLMGGTCRALVCCVGATSTRGITDVELDTREQETELTQKLDNIGGSLKFVGLLGAFVILGVSILVVCIQTGADEDVGGKIFIKKLVDCAVIALIILIVAIPEGLPMTVAISLAHSVLLMSRDDNVLVRDLGSVEQVGLVTDLCLGKTGTMTTEEMEVVNYFTQNLFVLNSRKNTLFNCDLDPDILNKLIESVVFNAQAHIEMNENSFYVPVGNGTDVSLIKWLQAAEVPVHDCLNGRGPVLAQVPFNSTLKRSIIAVQHTELHDTVRVYVKGAPEKVIANCRSHYVSRPAQHASGEKYQQAARVALSEGEKGNILKTLVSEKMTRDGLRAIAFSFCDMTLNNFQNLMNSMSGEIDDENEIAALEQDQTLLGVIGLKDPIRPGVKDVIAKAVRSRISLRLVSGDHLETTAAVARDVGILSAEEEQGRRRGDDYPAMMDAAEFRRRVGEVVRTANEEEPGQEQTYTYQLEEHNQQEFNRIIANLKVLGRAEPEDKLRLVTGLRGMSDDGVNPEKKVAVVGEGINDVEAFAAANVSFAVADATSLARNRASMVLKSSDFSSCMQAVMWGRNIYMNVQRFLQFQITCNLSVLVVVIVSYATKTESVLNAVQLIWVNLIMDILGALALAATRPTDAIIDFEPGQGKLITPFMYRQIIGITLFQIGIMMVIMYGGKSVFEVDYEASTQTIEDDAEGKMKRTHFTLIWNTFIWLQFFNLINCRDVSAEKMHGCEKLHKNFLTWLILLIIGGVQVAGCFTFLGFLIFEARKTEGREFAVCVVAAASVIVANALLKLIPARWIAKMPALDESKALGGGSKLMSAYEKQAAAKALPARKKKEDQDTGYPEEDSFPVENDDGFQRA